MKRVLLLFLIVGLFLVSVGSVVAENETVNDSEDVACAAVYDPVCGVDGNTYSNSCGAEVAGVEVDYEGECNASEANYTIENESDSDIGVEQENASDSGVSVEEDETDDETEVEIENEEDEDGEDETQMQVKVMKSNFGAQVRMLQLEKAIYRMIVHAEAIIDLLKEQGNDVSDLEALVEEMNLLLAEVQEANTDGSEVSVREFIALKEDAIELRKKFSETVRDMLTDKDKIELRTRFLDIDRDGLKSYKEQIRMKIRQHNALQIKTVIESTGISLEDLENKIKNGEMSLEEALMQIKMKYLEMEESKRKQIKNELKEELREREKKEKELYKKAKERLAQELKERAEARLQALEEKGIEIRAELKTRANKNA